MASKRSSKKKRQQQTESKLIYIPFAVLAVILVAIFVIPSLIHNSPSSNSNEVTSSSSSNSNSPFFAFAKVSDQDFAGNSVAVYMISWYGCPNGAANSWGLYLALSHYGIINASPIWSDNEPLSPTYFGRVPGLIFYGLQNSSNVKFYPIYILGRIYTNNGTATLTNGTTILTTQIMPIEEEELQKALPAGLYDIIEKYQLNTTFPETGKPIAFSGNPPHIITMIIVTGPKGTWMLIGYPQSLGEVPLILSQSNLTPEQLYQAVSSGNLSGLPSDISSIIEQEAQIIQQVIQEAAG